MPNSKSAPTLADVPSLLLALRNHLDAANRHHEEALRIEATLRRLLPPDSPLLDLMTGESRN